MISLHRFFTSKFSYLFFTCILFSGCSSGSIFSSNLSQETIYQLPIPKQKQRIAFLHKKIEVCQREVQKVQNELDQLSVDLQHSELALIEKLLETHEQQAKKIAAKNFDHEKKEDAYLFLKEREILQKMLENGPSPEAFEAQTVLDKILQVITKDHF